MNSQRLPAGHRLRHRYSRSNDDDPGHRLRNLAVCRRLGLNETMTATRYFTVDSVVQQVQPVASTATTATSTTTANSTTVIPTLERDGIVQVVAGYNRDRDQTVTTAESSSLLKPTADHRPTSVHHLPVSKSKLHVYSTSAVALTLTVGQ